MFALCDFPCPGCEECTCTREKGINCKCAGCSWWREVVDLLRRRDEKKLMYFYEIECLYCGNKVTLWKDMNESPPEPRECEYCKSKDPKVKQYTIDDYRRLKTRNS